MKKIILVMSVSALLVCSAVFAQNGGGGGGNGYGVKEALSGGGSSGIRA